ncbi:MAG: branched-chain amino acid ABC transporter permease, partial [Burkholderiales bacterium]
KALIIVIMGGVGNLPGGILAAFMLGAVESFVAIYGDPQLTLASNYALFLAVLLFRPNGLFGRASR